MDPGTSPLYSKYKSHGQEYTQTVCIMLFSKPNIITCRSHAPLPDYYK